MQLRSRSLFVAARHRDDPMQLRKLAARARRKRPLPDCAVDGPPTSKITRRHATEPQNSRMAQEKPSPGIAVKNECQPQRWKAQLEGIREMRKSKTAAVDTMGAEVFVDNTIPPHESRFRVLIAAMLSSQTKDAVTAGAMNRLIEYGLTVPKMAEIDEKQLAELIYPVGFFNNKTKYIKKTAKILLEGVSTNGVPDIPTSAKELVKLPGVGPKMAHLVMNVAWTRSEGICVDIHVHRIANRLGWVKTWNRKGSQDPEKTRKELEEWLPREHWVTINPLLVGFGQEICKPVKPACQDCLIKDICPSAFKCHI